MNTQEFNSIFENTIAEYHKYDSVDQPFKSDFNKDTLEYLLHKKNWIDTVQWHLEDIIREPSIEPVKALEIKRRIDKSNQDRTDLVELLDDYFFKQFEGIKIKDDAFIATETPAWAVDRLSILNLKIYHMKEEAEREDASIEHRDKCSFRLNVLLQQREDLSTAIDQLFGMLNEGKAIIKTYKQMKMYNDPNLNPVLRKAAEK